MKRDDYRGLRSLAEAIILQSIEDLWDSRHKDESMEFFRGEGFKICAEIAGLNTSKQLKILRLLGEKRIWNR
jgi:hypothetical protein